MRLVLACVLLTACADVLALETVGQPPAPGVDPCAPDAVVPPQLSIAGTLLDATNDAPLVGLSVDATPGGVAPTDAAGRFAIEVTTGGVPVAVTLRASGAQGFPPHAIHYERPFVASTMEASSKLLPSTVVDSLYGSPRGAETSTALVAVQDCLGNGIADATVELDPPSPIVYQGGDSVTNGTGVAYATNVARGAVTVRASGAAPYTYESRDGEMQLVYLVAP